MELKLLCLDEQLILQQPLKNTEDMLSMFMLRFGKKNSSKRSFYPVWKGVAPLMRLKGRRKWRKRLPVFVCNSVEGRIVLSFLSTKKKILPLQVRRKVR